MTPADEVWQDSEGTCLASNGRGKWYAFGRDELIREADLEGADKPARRLLLPDGTIAPERIAISAELIEAKRQIDELYAERNMLALALGRALDGAGYPVGFGYDDKLGDDATNWPIIYIDPTYGNGGQVSWHLNAAILPDGVVAFIHSVIARDTKKGDSFEWDGHSTVEKNERLAEYVEAWADPHWVNPA